MDKIAARKLVKDTFERPFDKPRFTYFAKNLFQSLDQSRPFTYQGNTIPKAYQDYISSLERVGQVIDSDQKKIDTLIVRLKKETSLERARTMQRNFIAWYLNGSRDYKDAAVVAFLSPDEEDWRFSLVKMEYSLDDDGKPIRELTPARRWSFLVGAEENSHTAQSQLEKVLESELQPSLSRLEDAFNVEVVTREFFNQYRELFHNLTDSLQTLVAENALLQKEFGAKDVDIISFAKKLLGQIVFLYFLQKKGWLGVASNKNWGEGDKRFLRNLFHKAEGKGENFFNGYLEYLFYDALARQDRGTVDPAYYPRFQSKIPFLNGGLFDPINNYSWKSIDLPLPNKLFSNRKNDEDEGTGILDVFDLYNFTVREEEPLEREVAIDPEMLGKVFENLLEVKDRKSKGTYYTPREIVHYMCQESLINYLDMAINAAQVSLAKIKPQQGKLIGLPDPHQSTLDTIEYESKVPRSDIEFLIRKGELSIQNDEHTQAHGETGTYTFKLPESVRENAALIDDKLRTIRVCDPAIGSGAFPVGIMTEIVRSRSALTPFLAKDGRSNYVFKREAIQECLYGVDIDPGAVEIAKLRLWLSLVVEEDEIVEIRALPNLDYKIVCGDSLLGMRAPLFSAKQIEELRLLKTEYFAEIRPDKKVELRSKIDKLIDDITQNDRDFDFRVYFSEVFQEKGGFDVVIANPPYISAVQDSKNSRKLREIYRNKYTQLKGAFDIYVVFLLKGTEIANIMGSYAWIIPNKFMVTNYAEDALKYLKRNGLYSVVSVSLLGVFEDVGVYPIMIFGNKFTHSFCQFEVDNLDELRSNSLRTRPLTKQHKTFKDFGIKIASGATGFQATELIKYISENPRPRCMPFVVSGSIDSYHISFDDVRYMKKKYRRAFIRKGDDIAVSKWSFWQHEKIVIAGMTKKIEAAYMKEPLALGVGVYAIYDYGPFDPKFLLALLNSRYLSYYLNTKFKEKHLAGGYLAINKSTIEQLPIVKADEAEQKPFIHLVDEILIVVKEPDYLANFDLQAKVKKFQAQIDQMVYQIFQLSPEEMEIAKGGGNE